MFYIKKILFLFLFVFLTNCSAPGSAFLGPVFTGAKTGSIYQASLSYSGNRVFHNVLKIQDLDPFKKINLIPLNNKITNNEPLISNTFAVAKIEISDVLEPEPLP